MYINLSGISVEVRKKNIKNMYLSVKPPDGHVIISAPTAMDDKAIEMFARVKLGWIKKHRKKFEEQPLFSKRQYITGETMYIWGKQYILTFQEDLRKNSFMIQGNQVILSMKNESTVQQREYYVRERYRSLLKIEIDRLLPKWEHITGLKCDSWHTKYMTTRWGTCNTVKRRLWFNVQLAQKSMDCLEYVILHELAHLKVRNHGPLFVSIMDRYMSDWRGIKKKLNAQELDYL